MIKRLVTFQCEICGSAYPGKESARTCEAQGLRGRVDGIEVGSVVETGRSYSWHNYPDSGWTRARSDEQIQEEQGYKTIHCHRFCTRYVVTRIDTRDHEVRYHLFCLLPPWAEKPEELPPGVEPRYDFRWNCPTTHMRMRLVPEVEVSEAISTWRRNELEKWKPRRASDLL